MAGKDIIMLSQRELRRLHIIQKVVDRTIRQTDAAEVLSLSDRQIRRIIKRLRIEGDHGLAHKSRGRPSNRGFSKEIKDKSVKLYRQKYSGFGPTLASEKLFEIEGIKINNETLRKWLLETGDWKKTRGKRAYRQWRERKDYYGEMVQIDGSHHDWFEGRGPRCVLMGYVDDATGKAFGRFYPYEGTIPAMDSFKRYIKKHGIPMSVYLDKHSTYKSTARPSIQEELNNTEPLSEFERAMKELAVRVIHANSPQAKGRVERFFGTLQDRLIKEMRLRGTKTTEQGNMFLDYYLPMHNRRFSLKPKGKGDLHRNIPKGLDLDNVLCIKTERTVRNDFTVAHDNKFYQIEDKVKASKVVVHDGIDGSVKITYKDAALKFKEISTRPIKEKKRRVMHTPRKTYIPPVDHPWRNFKLGIHKYERKKLTVAQI